MFLSRSNKKSSVPRSSAIIRGIKKRPLGRIIWLALFIVILPVFAGCGVQLNPEGGWSGVVQSDINEGEIYFGSLEGRLLALDKDGSFLWSFPPPEEDRLSVIYSTPDSDKSSGLIYVADLNTTRGNGTIYAIYGDDSSQTGKVAWQRDLEATVVGGITVVSDNAAQTPRFPPIVLVGTSDNKLHALTADTGNPFWTEPFIANGPIWSTPAVDIASIEPKIYIGSLDHSIYSLLLSTGDLVWEFQTGAGVTSSPLVSDGKVYVGSFDRNLYAIDTKTGLEEWRFTAENWFWGGAISDGERIYAGSLDGRLYALDAHSGVKWWDYSTEGPIVSTPVFVEGHGVVVASLDKSVYLLDSDSGVEVWSRNIGGQVFAPLYSSESRVYFPTLDHTLWALDIPGRKQAWTLDTETLVNR
jgi:outer membrane protein assembly factor BamB